MTYLVSQARGYTVRGRYGTEIHECETFDHAYCCDRGCAWRYMIAIGVPGELRQHPLGHGAGEWIDLRDIPADSMDAPIVSWGEWPCADSPHHEYCPACGGLTIVGDEEDELPAPWVSPDPCMAAA